jgi:hypothetical protein
MVECGVRVDVGCGVVEVEGRRGFIVVTPFDAWNWGKRSIYGDGIGSCILL